MSNAVPADRLRGFVERIERVREAIADLRGDEKEIKAEAKAEGYAVKTINELIKLRGMGEAERQEHEALLDLYKAALGMLDGTPLGAAAVARVMAPPKPPPPSDDAAANNGEDECSDQHAPEPGGFDLPEEEEAPAPPTDEDVEDARRGGGDAAREGAKVLDNPWPAQDARRAAWDEGWCQALGSDGMDLPSALRPDKKPKNQPPEDDEEDDQSDDDGGSE